MPIPELKSRLPLIVFGAGLAGTALGIGLQWYTNAFDYPFLISGKPLFSLPAFIPVAFETTILLAAIAALLGMLALNGLPRFHHPLFSNERFRGVTTDRFFIAVEASDPGFDAEKTEAFLRSLGSRHIDRL